MKLRLIRSATLVIEIAGRRLLVDPDFGPRHSRPSFTGRSRNPLVELPVPIDAVLDQVDLVLVSHLHQDHFDQVAAEVLPKGLPLLCQPEDEELVRSKGFTHVHSLHESLTWNGMRITRTPGEHGQGAVLDLMGTVSGWVLQAAGEPTVYWAGDTVLCPSVRQTLVQTRPAVVVTHSCGAVWPDYGLIVMDAAQTIEVCRLVPDATVVAVHMDAFDHATVSRLDLRAAAQAAGIDENQLRIPADGEHLSVELQ